MKYILLSLTLALLSTSLFGAIQFDGLDLAEDNRLLFKAQSTNGTNLQQHTLFLSRLSSLSIQQLTAFPERLDLMENGRTIQVRNSFGAMRIPVSGGLPQSIRGFPSFASGASVLGGRVEEMAPSADGRWLLVVEPVSPAHGNLVLINVQSGEKLTITSRVERPDKYFPASWSPDSRVFVYVRDNKLYYYTINANSSALVDEKYRLIGDGAINSVYWGSSGDFFYLTMSTVYRVRGSELFARTLYSGFLEIGVMVGQIPFSFDPNFDSFWIGPDGRAMLLAKGGRNIFYYPLDFNVDQNMPLPYLMVPWSSYGLTVLWPPNGYITLFVSTLGEQGTQILSFRLNTGAKSMVFTQITPPAGMGAALSPDGTKALFWGQTGIVLFDYINWRMLQTVSTRPAFSCIWLGNEDFIIGDERRIERVRISGRRELICLSSAQTAAFEDEGNRILIQDEGTWFGTDGFTPWTALQGVKPRPASLVSPNYRVYLEQQLTGPYNNVPMIRNTQSTCTTALLSPQGGYRSEDAQVNTSRDASSPIEKNDFFAHGRRNGFRELSVCFDVYDDASGLPDVLDALKRFNIRTTFFLNGEFIRRHPEAAREIANAGHEIASMFFAPIDLSDARFLVGGDFVSRGLARNEDEFYQTTGKELSLLWHPPFYGVSAEIIRAAARAGYRTIGQDVDPMDWLSLEYAQRIGMEQMPAADMVELIMEQKQPGSIIPIRLGLLPGGRRSGYLFNRINVLLDALTRASYNVVPVSVLIEHAR